MNYSEKCSCGAVIDLRDIHLSLLNTLITEWRIKHVCMKSIDVIAALRAHLKLQDDHFIGDRIRKAYITQLLDELGVQP